MAPGVNIKPIFVKWKTVTELLRKHDLKSMTMVFSHAYNLLNSEHL